uniref:Uncharacterized protein n=1 Tax=Bursaphelenchus xylophilus TaxID=6326 RepID=A0A1I7S6Q1_BURXY
MVNSPFPPPNPINPLPVNPIFTSISSAIFLKLPEKESSEQPCGIGNPVAGGGANSNPFPACKTRWAKIRARKVISGIVRLKTSSSAAQP